MEIEFVAAVPPGMGAAQLEQSEIIRRAFARRDVEVNAIDSIAEYWCRRFGVARQADWPVAPFRLDNQAASEEDQGAYWLCADPVHMHFDADRVLFDPHATGDLDAAQAAELAAILNAHFSADGMQLRVITPTLWLLRMPRALQVTVPEAAQAHGRPALRVLPRGADAAWLRRISSEAQMLLHAAPANAAREARHLPTINSLWLWGGGTRPRPAVASTPQDMDVFSGDAGVRGLARAAGCAIHLAPAQWAQAAAGLKPDAPGKALIDMTEFSQDPDWAERLRENWVEPAAISAKTQKFTFSLTLLMSGKSLKAKLYRSDLFHFFCRKSLAGYVDNIQNSAIVE